jgi:tRNA-Thr(GGU) m(6)t(6)A37 methyltransferase TsaA
MNREYLMKPIGIIHAPFTEKECTPIQSTRSHFTGQVEVYAEYAEALEDIEGFSHLILLYVFHRSQNYQLKVRPFLDDQEHGLFATRHPDRPNPIGLSVVRLLKRVGDRLEIEGVDTLDGTPLLDIKPYVPDFDVRLDARAGWYETRSKP